MQVLPPARQASTVQSHTLLDLRERGWPNRANNITDPYCNGTVGNCAGFEKRC